MQNEFTTFLAEYESKVVELSKETSLSYFNASISGKAEDYKKSSALQLKLDKIFADKENFELLKKFKSSGEISDPILSRQLDLIYNNYAANQFDESLIEKIISLSSKIEERFATYRAVVNGKNITDNQIDSILETSNNSRELEEAWLASKQIGKEVAADVLKLVLLRNDAARQMGYKNYHEMSLLLSEQSSEEIEKLFDELDLLTRDEFSKLKNEIDTRLSTKCNISKNNLMPWHYQDKFFQQGPKIYKVNLDSYFEGKDLVEITRTYFNNIGLTIDDLIKQSDLFEKPGKYQHAYCTDIDRCGDVRVVCNVQPNHRWMSTLLHEFGHAAYDKFVDPTLPWTLRSHAHVFVTEAIAMMFGRFSTNPKWLQDIIGVSKNEIDKISSACFNSLKLEQLVFSRWVQVMYRFEKSMYENPEQNLNLLWRNLVEKYQLIKLPEGRNEPDWAAKIHIALYPAYYHNYMLGELLASQLYFYITQNVLGTKNASQLSFANQKEVGTFLIRKYFSAGSRMHWRDLIKYATGEELTPKYYAKQFLNQ